MKDGSGRGFHSLTQKGELYPASLFRCVASVCDVAVQAYRANSLQSFREAQHFDGGPAILIRPDFFTCHLCDLSGCCWRRSCIVCFGLNFLPKVRYGYQFIYLSPYFL